MKKLDDAFNISETEVVETEKVGITPEQKPDRITKDDITRDYEYTRGNLYSIIEKGQEAIQGILDIAKEGQHPRAYEVVGQLIKTLTDTNDRIVDIQKKAQELLEPKDGPSKVTNNLFVGNTSELTRLLGGNARDVLKKDI